MVTNVPAQPLWWRHERHGLSEWWLAGGELKHSRFELPSEVPPRPNVLLLGARFQDIDFSRCAFDGFMVADSLIENCSFNQSSFAAVHFGLLQYQQDWTKPIDWSRPLAVNAPHYRETRYIRCQFSATKLPRRNTYFGNSRFEECLFSDTLRSTVVAPIFTKPAEFVNCRFAGLVSCVVFDGKVQGHDEAARLGRNKSEFIGNDFTTAVLKSVDFRDIDMNAQRLPGNSDSETVT